jgi:hypothetical protein
VELLVLLGLKVKTYIEVVRSACELKGAEDAVLVDDLLFILTKEAHVDQHLLFVASTHNLVFSCNVELGVKVRRRQEAGSCLWVCDLKGKVNS